MQTFARCKEFKMRERDKPMIGYRRTFAGKLTKQGSIDHRRSSIRGARMASLKKLLCIALSIATGAFGSEMNAQTPVSKLQGRWDLTIDAASRKLPSWIEVTEDQGHDKLVMVGITDHATPLQKFTIKPRSIEFISPKDEEGFSKDMSFKGKLVGDKLEGTVSDPDGDSWPWTGVRAPTLKRNSPPRWEQAVTLLDGRDLDGWHLLNPSKAGTWKVDHGILVSTGHGTELVSNSKFEDFKLHVEFKCGPSSNSGVYLRGRYEVQIETDSAAEPNSHHTGGVYGFIDPTPEQPRIADVWQAFDITLIGRTLTIVQNGVTIIDSKEIPGITGGALDSHEALPGPIYLQGTEEGTVMFRNIVITPARRE
jgi:Domain of Unknown Function (DUF1080)